MRRSACRIGDVSSRARRRGATQRPPRRSGRRPLPPAGAVNADSMSTGAITNGSASISTSATGCAGSVDSAATMVTPSAAAGDRGHHPVVGVGEGDDQLRAETGWGPRPRVRVAVRLAASSAARAAGSRGSGPPRWRRRRRRCRRARVRRMARRHATRPQPDRCWAATGWARSPHHTPREPGPARRARSRRRRPGVASSVQPRSTTVFHNVRQRSGSVIAWRAASGGHSVRRMPRTVSRSDSCSEVSPTSIRALT